jgi:uncharacterized protein YyaL (SSP411 family)
MTHNRLIKETSAYLRNHAHQKINWYPWCDEAFAKAKKEGKMIFISIGFSACHWCHELSRNCFENDAIAQVLNRYYVSIKVDREERPDIDQFYMNAVEIITNSSGWPVSCFLLPDGSPIYGGTYFPPDQFIEVILGFQQTYENDREKVVEIGKELMGILRDTNIIERKPITTITLEDVKLIVEPWRRKFDHINGGTLGSPKFPLPISLIFLLDSGYYLDDPTLITYVETTLDNIAKGGIYDHLRGAFFRYTEDLAWRNPHFEKMLYDNAMLIAAFSRVYRRNHNPLYKEIISETVNFIKLRLSKNNLLRSSVDAEARNIEGDYYTWKNAELKEILGADYDFAADYFGVKENKRQNVLFINMDVNTLSENYDLSPEECKIKIKKIKSTLLEARENRVRPNIDSKILAGWNSLYIGGLCEAYRSFGDNCYLEQAKDIADALIKYYISDNYKMYRVIENQTPAFLDDYAFTINAFVRLYRVSAEKKYLDAAEGLLKYTFDHFFDPKTGMFFFTDDSVPSIIPRMMDFIDKAYPSSNSMMAKVLITLSFLEHNKYYNDVAIQMINNMKDQMHGAGPYVAHWASLLYRELFQPVVTFIPKEHLADVHGCFAPNLLIFPDNVTDDGENPAEQDIWQNEVSELKGNYSLLADYAVMKKNSGL